MYNFDHVWLRENMLNKVELVQPNTCFLKRLKYTLCNRSNLKIEQFKKNYDGIHVHDNCV